MKSFLKCIAGSALCVAIWSTSAAPVLADPSFGISRLEPPSANQIEPVQYRRDYGRNRYNRSRGNSGGNLAIGIGAAIIGGIILSEAARSQHRHEHASDWERCEQTYRSFEPRTGMYTGYDGIRHTCPYLN